MDRKAAVSKTTTLDPMLTYRSYAKLETGLLRKPL
jgi:hypothetical protein